MNTLPPDIEQATRFLAILDPSPNAQFGFATFDDKGDDCRLAIRLYGDLRRAVRLTGSKRGQTCSTIGMLGFMQKLGAGVFVTVQELDGRGAAAANVRRSRAFVADADTDQQIANVQQFISATELTPSAVVASGGRTGSGAQKQQLYWFVSDCPLDVFAKSQALLPSRTGTDTSAKDISRVLRLVGFAHQKGEPRLSQAVSYTGIKYNSGHFVTRLQAAPQIGDFRDGGSTRSGRQSREWVKQSGSNSPTARLRVLLQHYGSLVVPAVHALLREATGPTDDCDGRGNRHSTLLTVVSRVVQVGWPDEEVRVLVLPVINAAWDGGDWSAHLDKMLAWVRQQETAAYASKPVSPRAAHLAIAFGAGRRGRQ